MKKNSAKIVLEDIENTELALKIELIVKIKYTMIAIIPYKKTYQIEIDLMKAEIALEFKMPISTKTSSITQTLDNHWLAIHQSKIIGTIGILKIENTCAILKNMFVKKEFRGGKYGTAKILLKKISDWCLAERISYIYLGTMRQFEAAHHFYEKNGFIEIEEAELPSDFTKNPLDSVFYCKKL